FTSAMRGRLALASGIEELSSLRERASRMRVGSLECFRLALGDDARGRIVVGDRTFLFQLVEHRVVPKPQLPLAVRTGSGVDWTTTIIAAFSFLFHFGIVGALYSDWIDPIVDETIMTGEL